jgi:predicted DNA-binding protein
MMVEVGEKYLQVRIAPEDRAALKVASKHDGRTMSGTVRWLISQYLEENRAPHYPCRNPAI